jgi:hypothetical protein
MSKMRGAHTYEATLPALEPGTGADDEHGAIPYDTGVPRHVWRVNFYRYSYPDGPNAAFDNYELNAWSPTHGPSFHVPNRFGVIVLDPPAEPFAPYSTPVDPIIL